MADPKLWLVSAHEPDRSEGIRDLEVSADTKQAAIDAVKNRGKYPDHWEYEARPA